MSIIASALVGVLALATPALAQESPTQDAYGGVIAEVVTPSKPTTPKPPAQQQAVQQSAPAAAAPTTPQATSTGSLPFTGLQVTLVLLAGAALLGGGLVLRRATTSD